MFCRAPSSKPTARCDKTDRQIPGRYIDPTLQTMQTTYSVNYADNVNTVVCQPCAKLEHVHFMNLKTKIKHKIYVKLQSLSCQPNKTHKFVQI